MKKYFYSGVECTLNCGWHERNVIYLLKFPAGGLYIGQTTQKIGTRIKQHCIDSFQDRNYRYDNTKNRAIRKYKTFNVDILEKCLSVDQMNKREDEIIKEYKAKGLKLYNTASGGLNNCEYFGVKCVITDTNFDVIRTFDTVKDAREYVGVKHPRRSMNGKYFMIKKKYFILSENDYSRLTPCEHIAKCHILKTNKSKSPQKNTISQSYNVVQVDYKYKHISTMGITDAVNKYGRIVRRAARDGGHANGYYWIREDDYNNILQSGTNIKNVLNGLNMIYQVNTNKNIIGEYQTIAEASRATGHCTNSVSNSIRVKTFISSDYFFMNSDRYHDLTDEYVKEVTNQKPMGGPIKVYEYNTDGSLIREYRTINDCAKAKGVSKSTIRDRARSRMPHNGVVLTHSLIAG